MKILDVSEFYAEAGGGVRTYTHAKVRAASAAGHELVVVAPGGGDGEERREGGRFVWLKNPRLPLDARYGYFSDRAAVHRLIAREQPDLVEASSPWTGARAVASYPGPTPRALVFHQEPVAVYPHTLLDWALPPQRIDALCAPYWRWLGGLAARFDVTVTAAEWLAERLAARGLPRVEAVPFGCARAPFVTAEPDPGLRARLLAATGTPAHGKLLVCVSRLHPEKRLGTLFSAVARAREQTPVGLVVYGDGPLAGWLARMARRVPGVHLAGFTRDRAALARALASADALLHGSAAETFGIAVAEALWAGLPVIVPDRGGAHALFDEACGTRYRTGDAGSCARAIVQQLTRDRVELGLAARRHAAAHVPELDAHFAALFARYAQLCSARVEPSQRGVGRR